jgi:hypothetical protein
MPAFKLSILKKIQYFFAASHVTFMRKVILKTKQNKLQSGMVVRICNPSIQEAEG